MIIILGSVDLEKSRTTYYCDCITIGIPLIVVNECVYSCSNDYQINESIQYI